MPADLIARPLPLVLSRNRNHAGVVNCAPAVLVNHIGMRRLPTWALYPCLCVRAIKKRKGERGKERHSKGGKGKRKKGKKKLRSQRIWHKKQSFILYIKVFTYYVSSCKILQRLCHHTAVRIHFFPDQGTVDTAYNVSSYALNHLGEMHGGHAQPQSRNH